MADSNFSAGDPVRNAISSSARATRRAAAMAEDARRQRAASAAGHGRRSIGTDRKAAGRG